MEVRRKRGGCQGNQSPHRELQMNDQRATAGDHVNWWIVKAGGNERMPGRIDAEGVHVKGHVMVHQVRVADGDRDIQGGEGAGVAHQVHVVLADHVPVAGLDICTRMQRWVVPVTVGV